MDKTVCAGTETGAMIQQLPHSYTVTLYGKSKTLKSSLGEGLKSANVKTSLFSLIKTRRVLGFKFHLL